MPRVAAKGGRPIAQRTNEERARILLKAYIHGSPPLVIGYIEVNSIGVGNMKIEGSKYTRENSLFNAKEAEALVWCVKRSWWNISDEDIAENTKLTLEEAHVFTEKAVACGLLNYDGEEPGDEED